MPKPKFISRDPDLPASMDYYALRKEGIRYLQQLSGSIWTDYNEHDPGVTLLEQICFALTDVAYRTNISVEKLLFYSDDHTSVANSNALYGPNEIFPFSPLTPTDYRILIIDRIEEVNNAWFEPADVDQFGISSLYHVVVQVFNDVPQAEYEGIKENVKKVYADHRNVGEDIEEITILKPQSIGLRAQIGIATSAIGEEVLAEIYYRLTNYLNPAVQFYTYEELKLEGWPLERIFETPSFTHGFLKPDELHYRNDEFQITKIAEVITTTPGVQELQGLAVFKNGMKVYGNTIKIEADCFPQLDVTQHQNIELTRGGIPYNFDYTMARHLFDVKLDKHKNANQSKQKWKFDSSVAQFEFGGISNFSSIQNTLPGIYGLGRYGLAEEASEERKAKAKQLKGYLLHIDQVLANHLVQLQNIRELFSIESDKTHSYYTQLPVDFPGLEEVMKGATSEAVQQVMAGFDNFNDRKGRLLDHLLARFGEVFFSDEKIKSLFGDLNNQEVQEQIIHLKSAFLKNYVELSGRKSTAFNYLKDSIDQENVPTFKRRISYHLNIEDHRQRSLVMHLSGMESTAFEVESPTVEQDATESGQGKLPYRKAGSQEGKITFLVKGENWQEYLLLKGGSRSNYHIIAEAGHYLVLFYTSKRDFPVKLFEAKSMESARSTIDKLVAYFSRMSKNSEGFHVVEHVLLRPYGGSEFHFQILDKENAVLFQSLKSQSYAREKLKAEDALISGTSKASYRRATTKSGKHAIYLKDGEDRRIARFRGELVSEEAAVERIDELVQYFKEVEGDYTLSQKKIAFTAVKVEGRKMDKEFYNSHISLVFPNWVARFQNEEFRLLLHKCVRQSLPAHVDVNWVWLGIDELWKFERIQKEWLELRRQPGFDWKKLNSLSAQLIDILTTPENG